MKRTKPKRRRQPNYLRKLLFMYRAGALPVNAMHHVEIRHDSWCAHFEGQPCNCSPDVRLRCSVPGNSN
jgi:hypothetical protein